MDESQSSPSIKQASLGLNLVSESYFRHVSHRHFAVCAWQQEEEQSRGRVYASNLLPRTIPHSIAMSESLSVPRIASAALEHVESSINAARKLLSSSKRRQLYRVGASADTRPPLSPSPNVALLNWVGTNKNIMNDVDDITSCRRARELPSEKKLKNQFVPDAWEWTEKLLKMFSQEVDKVRYELN